MTSGAPSGQRGVCAVCGEPISTAYGKTGLRRDGSKSWLHYKTWKVKAADGHKATPGAPGGDSQ